MVFRVFLLLIWLEFLGQAASLSTPHHYFEMCDGSAAIALDADHFVVANDEDNILRVYHKKGGHPVQTFNFASLLQLEGKHPETDLEGAVKLGNDIFWITSHGSNQDGKPRPNRRRLFALHFEKDQDQWTITPQGKPYLQLVEELNRHPDYRDLGLTQAATQAPKSVDGLNIEGLAEGHQGELWIAFRNPIPRGKALVAVMKNPQEVMEGSKPQFGSPIYLNLGGLGIRDLVQWTEQTYLVIGGSYDGASQSQLFLWEPKKEKLEKLSGADFSSLNPESIIIYPTGKPVQILSDDGTEIVGGKKCKNLEDPQQKQFRGFFLNDLPRFN